MRILAKLFVVILLFSATLVVDSTDTQFFSGNRSTAARAAAYISDTQMTVGMTATDCSMQQTIAVRVENPAPGGGSSDVSSFSVLPAPPGYNYGDY